MALSVIRTAETGVEKYIKEVSEMQADVDACVALVEAACRFTPLFWLYGDHETDKGRPGTNERNSGQYPAGY
jgi:hypothetical protein